MKRSQSGVIAEARDVINVSHHLFFLTESGFHPGGALPAPTNGLADSIDNRAVIHTGIHSGLVSVTVHVRDGRPSGVDLDWDEVVEINLHAAAGHVRLAVVMNAVPDTYPLLTPSGPGDYRLRVHARGRDTEIDGTAFEPFEEYFIQIWPAAPEQEIIYRTTDRYGDELRRTWHPRREEPGTRSGDDAAAARLANLRAHSREKEPRGRS